MVLSSHPKIKMFKKAIFLILSPIYVPAAVLLFLTFEWWSELWN